MGALTKFTVNYGIFQKRVDTEKKECYNLLAESVRKEKGDENLEKYVIELKKITKNSIRLVLDGMPSYR